MEFFCRHCDELVTGDMYRVISEEDGIVLLDMIVCRSCYDEARELGLECRKVTPGSRLPLSRLCAIRSMLANHRSDRAL
jgi:RNase P subunit RPR2